MTNKLFPPLGLAALCAPIAAFAYLQGRPGLDPVVLDAKFHFWVVSGTALAAALACVTLIISARTLRETRLVFLALAFLAIAGIFSVHGLLTPGYFAHTLHASVPVSAWVSTVAGGIFVALSAMTMPQRVEAIIQRAGSAVFAWIAITISMYTLMSFAFVDWLAWVPTDERSVVYVAAFASVTLYGFAAVRYFEAYRFAKLPSQLAMVIALVLLCQVPPIVLWGTTFELSWWIYHALYATAFLVLFTGWAIEAQRAGSLKVIAEALSMRDALAQLNRGHDEHMLELVDAIETKDVATLGHVRRVGAFALAIGKQLALPADQLRSLALAAQMHDVGKIGVPDAILLKPGPLDDAELTEMRQHTQRGDDIASRVGVLKELAPIIRAHHERMNGGGYPDGLAGNQIPLLARIIGVADSYDAMTSDRPYRGAMTHDEAIAELLRTRGTELDAPCVDAFIASQEVRHAHAA